MGQIEAFLHKKVYLDSNIIIYLLEGYEPYAPFFKEFLHAIHDNLIICCTNPLAITEVCQGALKKYNDFELTVYKEFFFNADVIELYQFEQNDFLNAAFLCVHHKIKTPDALHLAAACSAHCDIFLTNDKAFKKFEGIEILYTKSNKSSISAIYKFCLFYFFICEKVGLLPQKHKFINAIKLTTYCAHYIFRIYK